MEKLLKNHWIQTVLFSLLSLFIWFPYISLQRNALDIYSLNKAVAFNAFFLIGISMGLASFIYFTKKFQNFLSYRVNLGVVGFFYGFVHALTSVVFYFFVSNTPKPNFEFGKSWPIIGGLVLPNELAFAFGIAADLIFFAMAILSLKVVIGKVGGLLWRKLLRYLGYTGMVLVMGHFLIKNFDLWINPGKWQGLPPLNLFLFIAGLVVLGLRIALYFKLRQQKVVQ